MWSYNYTISNELYHHGVKGMKWGVRRYQNPDGSLTRAGRKAARKAARKEERNQKKTAKKEENNEKRVARKAANAEKRAARKEKYEKMREEQAAEQARIDAAKKAIEEKGMLAAVGYESFVKQRNIDIEKGRRAAMSFDQRLDEDFERRFGDRKGVDGYDYDNEDFW